MWQLLIGECKTTHWWHPCHPIFSSPEPGERLILILASCSSEREVSINRRPIRCSGRDGTIFLCAGPGPFLGPVNVVARRQFLNPFCGFLGIMWVVCDCIHGTVVVEPESLGELMLEQFLELGERLWDVSFMLSPACLQETFVTSLSGLPPQNLGMTLIHLSGPYFSIDVISWSWPLLIFVLRFWGAPGEAFWNLQPFYSLTSLRIWGWFLVILSFQKVEGRFLIGDSSRPSSTFRWSSGLFLETRSDTMPRPFLLLSPVIDDSRTSPNSGSIIISSPSAFPLCHKRSGDKSPQTWMGRSMKFDRFSSHIFLVDMISYVCSFTYPMLVIVLGFSQSRALGEWAALRRMQGAGPLRKGMWASSEAVIHAGSALMDPIFGPWRVVGRGGVSS